MFFPEDNIVYIFDVGKSLDLIEKSLGRVILISHWRKKTSQDAF